MAERSKSVWGTVVVCALAVGLLGGAVALQGRGAPEAHAQELTQGAGGPVIVAATSEPTASPTKKLTPYKLEGCSGGAQVAEKVHGSPEARRGAQKGLDFLGRETVAWQERNNCYGCHVQAVTVEAFSVGTKHQYEIKDKQFKTILGGMLDLNGGSHHPGGLGHGSPDISKAAKVLGSAAFARYDQWVKSDLQSELLLEAKGVLELQQADGRVTSAWVNKPVGLGDTQYTAEAIVTWKQAYERSADNQWLTAIQKAEDWMYGVVSSWPAQGPDDIQELNYAAMGLLAAGVGPGEEVLVKIARMLEKRQNADGGWALGGESEQRVSGFAGGRAMNNMNGLDNFNGLNNLQQQRGAVEPAVNVPAETSGGLGIPSNAFGTGQTLYTLRLLGRTDGDAAIRRGTEWLIKNQKENGGWSEGGFGKAEAMWGVLGLVSIDVLTVSVDGLKDGQHVSQLMAIKADAKDNQGGGVVKVEATVDDIPAYGACGAKMDWKFDTSVLTEGKHVIDIKATNAKGEVSVRRFEVYAGNVFLTQMGNRFTGSGTEVSVRNIAPAEQKSRVRLEVYEVKTENGVDKPAERVKAIEQDGKQGAMNFFWDGKDDKGAPKNEGKYVAKVSFLDDKGKVIQTVDQPFIHASAEYQMNNFGQIQGQIALPNEAAAGNVELELVDDLGNVVQKTWSTQSGQYRFRNVDDGKKYQIRAKKAGFSAAAPVAPARAEENKADLKLIAE